RRIGIHFCATGGDSRRRIVTCRNLVQQGLLGAVPVGLLERLARLERPGCTQAFAPLRVVARVGGKMSLESDVERLNQNLRSRIDDDAPTPWRVPLEIDGR